MSNLRWAFLMIACVGGPPSSSNPAVDVGGCKKACDQLKFFNCNDSQQQADCYAACEQANQQQVELFNACVQNDICDDTCSTELKGTPPPAGTTGGGNTTGGGGNTTGGTPPDPAADCRTGCDVLHYDQCLSSSDYSACQQKCAQASAAARLDFVECLDSSPQNSCSGAQGCYATFNPSYTPPPPTATPFEITMCQDHCDGLAFFSCISPADQADCRALCTTESETLVTNFSACANSSGDGVSSCGTAVQCLQML